MLLGLFGWFAWFLLVFVGWLVCLVWFVWLVKFTFLVVLTLEGCLLLGMFRWILQRMVFVLKKVWEASIP